MEVPSWCFSLLIWVSHSLGVHMPRIIHGLLPTDMPVLIKEDLSQLCFFFTMLLFHVYFIVMTLRSLGPVIVKVARFSFWFLLANLSVSVFIIWFLAHVPPEEDQEKYRHKLRNSLEYYLILHF